MDKTPIFLKKKKKKWGCLGYDTKLHLMMKLHKGENLGSVEYPSIAITPRSTLTKSCSTC